MNATKFQRRGLKVLGAPLTAFGVSTLLLLIAGVGLLVKTRSDFYAGVSVDLAAKYAEQVTTAIDGHHTQFKAFPARLSELALPAGDPGYVPKLAFDASTGALLVDLESQHGKFGSLRYTATRTSNGGTHWRCQNISVATDRLPSHCSP